MKKLILPSLLALVAALSPAVQAQSPATANFDVNITLNSACRISTAPGAITVSYTSFDASPTAGTTTFGVECTNGFTYTLGFNDPTANSTSLGINIDLAVYNAGNTAAVSGTQTAGASATSYTIRATPQANQQGTCSSASCTDTVQRTLQVTY